MLGRVSIVPLNEGNIHECKLVIYEASQPIQDASYNLLIITVAEWRFIDVGKKSTCYAQMEVCIFKKMVLLWFCIFLMPKSTVIIESISAIAFSICIYFIQI